MKEEKLMLIIAEQAIEIQELKALLEHTREMEQTWFSEFQKAKGEKRNENNSTASREC